MLLDGRAMATILVMILKIQGQNWLENLIDFKFINVLE